MNNLATSLDVVERHPEDPDDLPVTFAWRELVKSIVDNPDSPIRQPDGQRWTRSSLAKKVGTTSSQMLKLLNGGVKSSAIVRKVNQTLGIAFVEPQPISRDLADIIEMILEIEDTDWLARTVAMVAAKK